MAKTAAKTSLDVRRWTRNIGAVYSFHGLGLRKRNLVIVVSRTVGNRFRRKASWATLRREKPFVYFYAGSLVARRKMPIGHRFRQKASWATLPREKPFVYFYA